MNDDLLNLGLVRFNNVPPQILGRGVLLEYFLGIVAVEGAFLAAEFLF
jgi:hypothetical protein